MSLLVRLLTTGRSLVDLKNPAGQYQMRRKNLLPKFGSKKNPFASQAQAAPVAPPQPAPVQTELLKPELSPAETVAANLKQTVPLPKVAAVPTPAPAVQPAVPSAAQPKAPGRISVWLAKLNPLAWLPARNAAGRPAIPKFSRPPMQGELSLENVRVVRNDLSDADVEIVPAKPVVKTQVRAVRVEAKTEKQSVLAEAQAD